MHFYYLFASLPFVISLLWLVIILLGIKESGRHGRFLLVFASACTVLYLCHFIHFSSGSTRVFSWIDGVWILCNLSVYPLFYMYIKSLTTTEPVLSRLWWTLLPAGITGAAALTINFAGGSEAVVVLAAKILFPTEVILTAIYGLRELALYRRKVENFYADTEGKTLSSIGILFIFIVIMALASSVANFLGRDRFFGNNSIAVPSVLFSSLLFALFHICSKVRFSAFDMLENPSDEVAEEHDGMGDELYERIIALMEEKRLYLRPGLKITDLASETGSNRTYISGSINSNAGMSFSDFIQKYRIGHSMDLLRANPDMQVEEIAEKSGYMNRTSFYRCFGKIAGCSPKEWLKRNQKAEK